MENKNDKYLLLREAVAKYEKDGKWGYLKSDGSVLLGQAFRESRLYGG